MEKEILKLSKAIDGVKKIDNGSEEHAVRSPTVNILHIFCTS